MIVFNHNRFSAPHEPDPDPEPPRRRGPRAHYALPPAWARTAFAIGARAFGQQLRAAYAHFAGESRSALRNRRKTYRPQMALPGRPVRFGANRDVDWAASARHSEPSHPRPMPHPDADRARTD